MGPIGQRNATQRNVYRERRPSVGACCWLEQSKAEIDEWLQGSLRIDWLRSQGYAK